jgi:hypothetical protein
VYKRAKIRASFQDKKSVLLIATAFPVCFLIQISSKQMPFVSKMKNKDLIIIIIQTKSNYWGSIKY